MQEKRQLLGEVLALEAMREAMRDDQRAAPEVIFDTLNDGVASFSVILVSDGPVYIIPRVTDPEVYMRLMFFRHLGLSVTEFTDCARNAIAISTAASEQSGLNRSIGRSVSQHNREVRAGKARSLPSLCLRDV